MLSPEANYAQHHPPAQAFSPAFLRYAGRLARSFAGPASGCSPKPLSVSLRVAVAAALVISALIYTQAEAARIISVSKIRPDKACGPRCLYALIHVTARAHPNCDIACIYEIIGKTPLTATNMKDLKYAAQQLGFAAEGSLLTTQTLGKVSGYAILPLGRTTGSALDPFHFVLVEQVIGDHVVLIDTKNLEPLALPMSDLKRHWNGFALVITGGPGMKPLPKPSDRTSLLQSATPPDRMPEATKDFGRVDAGSRLRHTFVIPNDKPTHYTARILKKSCSCLTAELGKDLKGNNTLTIEFHVNKPAWQQAYVAILLEPGQIVKKYAVRAYAKESFELHPRIGHIEAPDGGIIEYPVKIHYFAPSADRVQFDHVLSSIPTITSGPVSVHKSTDNGAATFTFDVPLLFHAGKPTLRATTLDATVNFILNTSNSESIIPMKLTAVVGRDLFTLRPARIFMIVSKTQAPLQKVTTLRFTTAIRPSSVASRATENLPIVCELSQNHQGQYVLKINTIPHRIRPIPPGLTKGNLTFLLDGLPGITEIHLPVAIFVKD